MRTAGGRRGIGAVRMFVVDCKRLGKLFEARLRTRRTKRKERFSQIHLHGVQDGLKLYFSEWVPGVMRPHLHVDLPSER